MNELIQADVFFFITSIFVVILTIILIISAYYFIGTLRNVRDMTQIAKDKVTEASEDMDAIKEHIVESRVFAMLFGKKAKKKTSSKTK